MGGNFATQYLPAYSHLLGEAEQPTNTGQLVNPQFGGSPEQLNSILQHPQMQQLLQSLGIHYDPNQIRQSPFLPQSFTQQHPQASGAISGALANVAATPEAPLVSGAGSGFTRAAQGLLGGPELLRQYQVRQQLAPFQAAGATIPGQEFQRKQALLGLLQQTEQDRQNQVSIRGEEPTIHNVQGGYVQGQYQPGQPAGGPQGVDFQSLPGQGRNVIDPRTGQPGQIPQQGLSPAVSPGWQEQFHATDPALIQSQADAKARGGLAGRPDIVAKANEQTQETQQGMPGAKVDSQRAGAQNKRATGSAALTNAGSNRIKADKYQGGGRGSAGAPSAAAARITQQYDARKDQVSRDIFAINQNPNLTPQQKQQAQQDATQRFEQIEREKQDAIRGLQGGVGGSQQSTSGLISPGANQGGAVAGQSRGVNNNPSTPRQQANIHVDEAGNLWDMSSGSPVYAGKQNAQAPPPPAPQQ